MKNIAMAFEDKSFVAVVFRKLKISVSQAKENTLNKGYVMSIKIYSKISA